MKRSIIALCVMMTLLPCLCISSPSANAIRDNEAIEMEFEPCDGIHMHGSSCTPTRDTKYMNGFLYRRYICDWCGGDLWKIEPQ